MFFFVFAASLLVGQLAIDSIFDLSEPVPLPDREAVYNQVSDSCICNITTFLPTRAN